MRREENNLKSRIATAAIICAVMFGVVTPHAAAQGCAMCYQTAAASSAPGREALRHGILILLMPAASLFVGICGLIYRRRNQTR